MDAHTTSDDPSRYRLSDELELWKLKDPIERVKVHLVKQQWADSAYFEEIEAESEALAVELREFCVNMPDPPPERIFANVYAEGNPVLEAQRDEFLGYVSGFAGGEH